MVALYALSLSIGVDRATVKAQCKANNPFLALFAPFLTRPIVI